VTRLFSNLDDKQRAALWVGAIVVMAAVLYLGVWRPYQLHRLRLADAVREQTEAREWMISAARSVHELRKREFNHGNDNRTEGLFSLIDRSAREASISASVTRMEPEGEHGARVWLEGVRFPDLLAWLRGLQLRHGVRVKTLALTRVGEAASVDGRLVLAEPGT
jgi:general secretion pathway protein M